MRINEHCLNENQDLPAAIILGKFEEAHGSTLFLDAIGDLEPALLRLLMSYSKPDPDTYWVAPAKPLAGEYPGALDPEEARRSLRRFLAAGVRHFIDLTEAGELEPYAELLTEEGI